MVKFYMWMAVGQRVELFSNHEIADISAREIFLGDGNIHYIIQQQPTPQ